MRRANGPVRLSFVLRGMVSRIPCRRAYCRIRRPLYPLSPTTRRGRHLGRPGPRRFTAPLSSNMGKMRASCRCPGVNTKVNSWPFPSARRWTLVLNPPWLRPNASVSGAFFCPSGVLMGPDHGAIDVVQIPIQLAARLGLLLDGVKHRLPEAGPLPSVEATGHGAPGPIAYGQIAPGCPGA
jgi:hypothetical protein